jgi:putative pyruvate formate lyase activating enzyme
VYNTGSYEKVEALQCIDEYVDIYLPDMKFYSPTLSKRYLNKEDYFDVASQAIAFMAKKPLIMREDGKMLSGTIVRHLVMPMGTSDSKNVLKWFANELPKQTYLSLMSQYTPFGEIEKFPELSRKVTRREYDSVLSYAFELGIENVFAQEREASDKKYIPDWDF